MDCMISEKTHCIIALTDPDGWFCDIDMKELIKFMDDNGLCYILDRITDIECPYKLTLPIIKIEDFNYIKLIYSSLFIVKDYPYWDKVAKLYA